MYSTTHECVQGDAQAFREALRDEALGGNKTDDKRALFQGDKIDESLRFAFTREYLAGFTVGMVSEKEGDDLNQRIERLAVPALKQEERVVS